MSREIKIIVTDSGLGGLSVLTRIAQGFTRGFARGADRQKVCLVYFNAWPEQHKGYNHLDKMEAKAAVFNNALSAMASQEPDRILIACNTLSVIYPHTPFSKHSAIPVTGILDHGVDMIENALKRDPDAGVIIFGTPTTAGDKAHCRSLMQRGIAKERIVSQGCTDLAGRIERNPFDPKIDDMIRENVDQAARKGARRFKTVYPALCCTHFGYCSSLFDTHIKRIWGGCRILNPNDRMADALVKGQGREPGQPEMDIRILSRVEWEPSRIKAYGRLIGDKTIFSALENYEFCPDLFPV